MSNYNPRVASLSPQIWFKFDESSGTPANSGLSTNCAISQTSGSPTLNQIGLINKSVLLDGNDGYRLDTGSLNSNVFGDGTFSIEAWVKTSSSTGIQEIFQMGVSTNSNTTFDAGWALRMNAGKPQAYYIGKANTTFTELTHATTISDNNWHHLVMTVKTTSGNYDLKLYVDGTLSQSDLTNSTTTPGSNADGTAYSWKRIAQSINNDEYFIGNIEQLAIYSTELTAANVLDTYNVGSYKFGKAYDHWISTTQSSNNAWQYHYTNNTRTTATLYSAYSTSGNELVPNEPQWDNNQNYLSNYPYVQRVTTPNTNAPSGEFRNSFNSTPNLLLHPADKTPNQYTAIAWKNTTGASVTVSGTVTLKLANPTNNFDGIDWWFQRELVNGTNYSLLSSGNIDNGVSATSTYNFSNVTVASGDRLFLIVGNFEYYNYDATIVTFEVNRVASVAADPSTTSTLMVDPAVSTTKSLTYSSDVVGTATADIVNASISISSNLDGFGVVGTASANIVDPTLYLEKFNTYSHTVATATALMTDATITTTRSNNYSASPATCSALFAANLHFGPVVQDTSYSLNIRTIAKVFSTGVTSNQSGSLTFPIGYQTSGANLDSINSVAIKPLSGIPTTGTLVKVRISDSTSILTPNAPSTGFAFNVYAYTANPSSGLTFDTMTYDTMPAKELLFTTRRNDDGGNYRLDLTAAFNNSNANNYGIYIEAVPVYEGSGTQYRRVEYSHSSGGNLTTSLFYILTSEFTNANLNIDPMTVSASMTEASISVERYVNYSHTTSTASADIVNPQVSIQIFVNPQAAVTTASAQLITPTLDFGANYDVPAISVFGSFPSVIVSAIKNVNIQVDPTTVNAELHMPGASVGEENIVTEMLASALFVMPTISIPEIYNADPMTASASAPSSVTTVQLLGRVFAEPMLANAFASNPPAYIDLFGDPWFASLYAQHSVRHGGAAGSGYAFLKIFEDQNTDIAQSTPNTGTLRQIRNNLTWGMAVNTGPENDNILVSRASAITDYSTNENPSRLSVGFFDAYNRKAVRLQNIGFKVKTDYDYLRHDFSLEFSIKTTKANQIIAYGEYQSQYSSGRGKTTLNLKDGKLNVFTYANYEVLHPYMPRPTNFSGRYEQTGNARIDDGQWHHIVIQHIGGAEMDDGVSGRFQIWIDGNLDIQRFGAYLWDPDFMGANIENAVYAPDFYTSAWSVDTNLIISERDIDLHYFDYIKYDPILAEPMLASVTHTNNNIAKGNRGRALMLYWWPVSDNQNKNLITRTFNSIYRSTSGDPLDVDTFDSELDTWDYSNRPPQTYYGWDVFPVDITGYYVSDLVKEEAYGGAENIEETWLGPVQRNQLKWKVNRRGYFRDTLNDTRRYIDLVNDIDLSQFDAIFFRNYPDQTNELEFFARNDVVDPYFNIRETKIYEDFVKSVRAAVDTGISLMVTNPQLALDLKIINRIDRVPDLDDISGYESDPYSPTIVPGSSTNRPISLGNTANVWHDTYKNNRLRVVNTLDRLTNWRSVIRVDAAEWTNDDTLDFGGPDRRFFGYQYKSNGLEIGDEFMMPSYIPKDRETYMAVPFANILAGIPITAFANQYRRGLELVDNPYKNHATTIAVRPGDVLDGKQCGGKIFVSFTERINEENEYVNIDAIHTDWINYAYNEGSISLAARNALLAQPDLLETQLAQGRISQAEYEKLSRWQSNGEYILVQSDVLEFDVQQTAGGVTRFTQRKFNKDGAPSTSTNTYTTSQFFTFKYARKYQQLIFDAMSMNTRGFLWISSRIGVIGQVERPLAAVGSATMVTPTVVGNKERNVNAQAMLANATKVPAVGYAGNDRNNVVLPLQASATMTMPVKLVSAVPMTATAAFREQSVIRTTAVDQVILYVLHEDPILYLREDIIK
jgi:hypothetical protein